jgi:hypothetical protein
MTPIYFPYTYLSRSHAKTLAAFFNKITVYQPSALMPPSQMQQMVESGFLDIRVPITGLQDKFDRAVRDFQHWAELYRDTGELKTVSSQGRYRFRLSANESTVSQILKDLRHDIKQDPDSDGDDPVFLARVFLEIAQTFDRQNDDIDQNLGAHDDDIQNLFREIKGDREDSAHITSPPLETDSDASGEYMVLSRLEAWTYLLQQDPDPGGIFITSSRSVVEHILDKVAEAVKVFQASIPYPRASEEERFENLRLELMRYCTDLSLAEKPGAIKSPADAWPFFDASPKAALTLYIIPKMTPFDSFSQNLSIAVQTDRQQNLARDSKNTLIGLIEDF